MNEMLGRLVRLVVMVPSEMLGALCDLVEKLASSGGDGWYTALAHFLRKEPCWVVVTKTGYKIEVYLHRLFTITLWGTKGKDTYATARKVFKGYFDSDFENWGIVFSGLAPKTDLDVYELVKDGRFLDFLGNTAQELEKRRLIGSQFMKLCRDHFDKFRGEGYANFIVLTRGDEVVAKDLSNVFVAHVYLHDSGRKLLLARVYPIEYDFMWYATCRNQIVSPTAT